MILQTPFGKKDQPGLHSTLNTLMLKHRYNQLNTYLENLYGIIQLQDIGSLISNNSTTHIGHKYGIPLDTPFNKLA